MKVLRVSVLIPAICCALALGFSVLGAGASGPAEDSVVLSVAAEEGSGAETAAGPAGGKAGASEKSEQPKPQSEASPEKSSATPLKGDEVAALKKRIIDLQNRGRLGFRKLVLAGSVDGYGVYSPVRPGGRVSSIMLYIEPSNYGTLITKDRYIIDCTVDVAIFRSDGKLIGGKKGILRINRVSRSPVLDLYYRIRLRLKKPLKRNIVIKTRIRDNIKNETATASYGINVKSGKKKMLNGV